MINDCATCRYDLAGNATCNDCDANLNKWGFPLTVTFLMQKAHSNAKEKGFWDQPREFGTMIALIHSELSEALEGHRKNDMANVAEELADVAIRLGDLCGGLGIDLESAILAKMDKNKARPRLHGKEY